jgi:hypothetical protein
MFAERAHQLITFALEGADTLYLSRVGSTHHRP